MNSYKNDLKVQDSANFDICFTILLPISGGIVVIIQTLFSDNKMIVQKVVASQQNIRYNIKYISKCNL